REMCTYCMNIFVFGTSFFKSTIRRFVLVTLISIYCNINCKMQIHYLVHKDLDRILKRPLNYDHSEKLDDVPT
ncbi:hypothetical protein ALC60_05838, partial [Trachymyrmex zeteki]